MPDGQTLDFEDIDVRWFVDGNDVGELSHSEFSFTPNIRFARHKVMGRSRPTVDSHSGGGSLSCAFYIEADFLDFMQAVYRPHEEARQRRDAGAGRIRAQWWERQPDGSMRGYALSGIHLAASKESRQESDVMTRVTGEWTELKFL